MLQDALTQPVSRYGLAPICSLSSLSAHNTLSEEFELPGQSARGVGYPPVYLNTRLHNSYSSSIRTMGQQPLSQLLALSCDTGSSDSELEPHLPAGLVVKRREKRRAANREAARRLRQRRQEQVLQLEGELAESRKATEHVTRKLGHVQSAHRKSVAEAQTLRAELAGLKMSMGLSAPLAQLDVASAALAANTGVLPSAHLLAMPAPLFPTGIFAASTLAAKQAFSNQVSTRRPSAIQLQLQDLQNCRQQGRAKRSLQMDAQQLRPCATSSPVSGYEHLDAPARGLLDAVALHFHDEVEAGIGCETPDSIHEHGKGFPKRLRSTGSRHSEVHSYETINAPAHQPGKGTRGRTAS
ncbi:hypothetical protein WJX74_003871 [Apatococcus lobatus]|uniref:BZIP domain-containing protein n=1 Tax=Apatococcus lobatus TaxID=904363 RepID=A0AAW1SBX7_9CHLO